MYDIPLVVYGWAVAYVTLVGGGGLWVMGSCAEVEAALIDESVFVGGRALLRWAFAESTLELDPDLVEGVFERPVANPAVCPDCAGRGGDFEPCIGCDDLGVVD